MSTLSKLGVAGLGIFIVSKLLKATADNAGNFAPRPLQGYDAPMVGYDAVAEALGCNCGARSFTDQGLQGFGSKLKKAFKKTVSAPVNLIKKDIKKIAAPVQKIVKKEVAQVKKFAITKPLAALKKSAQLVKRDLTAPMKLFSHGSKQGDAEAAAGVAALAAGAGIIYQDEFGNEITKDQYDAAIAAQNAQQQAQLVQDQADYGMTPGGAYGGDQSNVDEPTYSMDQVSADLFSQEENGADMVDAVMTDQASLDASGFMEDQPFLAFDDATEGNVNDQYDTWGRAPVGYQTDDFAPDPYGQQFLPEAVREQTMDAFAADQTEGNNVIMPAGEPAMPYTGDELMIAYEMDDNRARGGAWSPEPSGHGYGNPQAGVDLPGFYEQYGGWDWDWTLEGLGAVVARPDAHGLNRPAPMVLAKKPQHLSPYGYQFHHNPGADRVPPRIGTARQPERHIPLLADRKGNVYARNGGSLHRIGSLDAMAGGVGLGCAMFGRDMGVSGLGGFGSFMKKWVEGSKKVFARTTPSGFVYDRLKANSPGKAKAIRTTIKAAVPYALIAGGTAVTVVSLGSLSPAGVALIGAGVVELGAQGYSDVAAQKADHALDAVVEQERINQALDSTNVLDNTQALRPRGGPAPGEIPGGDWPWEYPGDGVWADFLDLTNAFQS